MGRARNPALNTPQRLRLVRTGRDTSAAADASTEQKQMQQEMTIEAVLRNPTVERALPIYEALRKGHGWPYPTDASREVAALAMIHKARLKWTGSTKAMVRESKAWLIEHGMSPTTEMPNLTKQ